MVGVMTVCEREMMFTVKMLRRKDAHKEMFKNDAELAMMNLNDVFGVWSGKAVLKTRVDCDT